MIDPMIPLVIASSLAVLFLLAARHKISANARFAAQLYAYKVLPDFMVKPVARVLPWMEVAIGAGLLFAMTRPFAAVAAAAMLVIYLLAMAVNLFRGRAEIDCGCGDTPQSLSVWLLMRNAILTVAALFLLTPVASRPLNLLDFAFAFMFIVACCASYQMLEQLTRNHTLLARKE